MKRASKFFAVALMVAACVPAHAAIVNINTATAAELDTLKGIGPTYAARIITYRTANGPFKTIEDIQDIKGIGPATFAGIKGSISVTYVAPAAAAPKPAAKATSISAAVPQPRGVASRLSATIQPAVLSEPAAKTQLLGAAGESAPEFPRDAVLVGLAGLIGLGALGVWHVRQLSPARKEPEDEETSCDADEFDIE